jgi:uncharacterized protein YdhG (YjbR/CyaY superfamily)
MARNASNSVEEYMASQPAPVQVLLNRVRSTIRKAIPRAEEVISYKILAYKLRGQTVLYLAGWKQHYSLYPCTGDLVAAFKKELSPYEVNNKGTVRFPLSEPVPVRLIERIARFRVKEVAEREKTKTARSDAKSATSR